MHKNKFTLQYGLNTVEEIQSTLEHSFKVFWVDSILLYKDTIFSSSNNKDFLMCCGFEVYGALTEEL